jgi:hypothetical protein
MEFIIADTLKKTFEVFGHFYNLQLQSSIFECRSVLEIKRKGTTNYIPDIIVVMMNPGSSIPIDKDYTPEIFSKEEVFKIVKKKMVLTRPDNAQYQIMRLMLMNKWDFVRILNLSDLRNGNSGEFQTMFREVLKIDNSNPQCMTHPSRNKELIEATKSNSNKILAAWGNIPELKKSAEIILQLDKIIIGLKIEKTPYFRYASPYKLADKKKWLDDIQSEIENNLITTNA